MARTSTSSSSFNTRRPQQNGEKEPPSVICRGKFKRRMLLSQANEAQYCLLTLCASTSAKPINHARHQALSTGSIAHLISTTNGPEIFALQEARSRNDRAHYLSKRASTWTVQAGDTGNGIAIRLSIDFIQLAYMNPNVQWRNLQIGQVLNIPCDDADTEARIYTVVAGDTGNAIAAAYGITFAQLDAFNPDVNWYNLQIGQTLLIPAPGVDATSIAQMPIMTRITQDATVTATEPCPASTTSGDDICASTTTTSITTISTTVTVPAPSDEPSTTSTSMASENTSAAMPMPNDANERSPFLTPGPPEMVKRSLDDHNNTIPKLVKLRLIRNEKSTDTDSAIQPIPQRKQLQRREVPEPRPLASLNVTLVSSTTYTIKAGDTGIAIAAAYGIAFNDLSTANPGVTWTNLQIGQVLNLPQSAMAFTTSRNSNERRDHRPNHKSNHRPGHDTYKFYHGAAAASYPRMSSWIDFETLWSSNLAAGNIGATCSFPSGNVTNNTTSETSTLKQAIQSVSNETRVNPSFIFAMVLQESNGCVRVPTTTSYEGIRNPGLLQSYNGVATCNINGTTTSPCPDGTIRAMIMEGIAGVNNVGIVPALKTAASHVGETWPLSNSTSTSGSSHRLQARHVRGGRAKHGKQAAGPTDFRRRQIDEAMLYYQAARIYNSGSMPLDGDLSGSTGSTRCYVSDIVNRLTGWVRAPKTCGYR